MFHVFLIASWQNQTPWSGLTEGSWLRLCVSVWIFLSWGIKTCSHKNNKRFIWGFRLVFVVEVWFRVMLRSRCHREIYVNQYDVLTSIAYQLSVCVCVFSAPTLLFLYTPSSSKVTALPFKIKMPSHPGNSLQKTRVSSRQIWKKKCFFMTFFCLTSLLFSLFIIIIWNLHTVIEFCVDQ